MALILDYPTRDIEKNAVNYWTAIYNYFINSPLGSIFDFTDLVIDTETYSNTGFSFSYKPSTPLYQIGNASPDVFTLKAGNAALTTIIFSQTIRISNYAAFSITYDTSGFTKDIPIKIAKSENCVYLFLFGKSKGDIFLAFEETGTGCAYIHPAYYYQMFYSAGSNTIYSSANASNYNAVAKGYSKKYYLKPLIIGSAVLYGLLALDGGVTTHNFSGDFKFNGKDYWGFAYSNSGNNFVLKL